MGTFNDLTGKTFGRLKVIRRANKEECNKYKDKKVTRWVCECQKDGNIIIVSAYNLLSGITKSCGCLRSENTIKFNKETKVTHGGRNDDLYQVWQDMKNRCKDENNKNYGGRGIKVCDEWNGPHSYPVFKEWALSHGYKAGLTIDRINNKTGNYEPSNCRWTDDKTQSNNKRSNHLIEYKGKMITIQQLSDITGIDKTTVLYRANKGMTGDEIASIPIKKKERVEELNNDTLPINKWAKVMNMPMVNIYSRTSTEKGWSFAKAISTPIPNRLINPIYYVDPRNGNVISQQDAESSGFTNLKNAISFVDEEGNSYTENEWDKLNNKNKK